MPRIAIINKEKCKPSKCNKECIKRCPPQKTGKQVIEIIDIEDISAFNMSTRKNKGITLKEAVDAFEKQHIAEVLDLVDGNKTIAAKKLGVHRNTLLAKTNKLQILR